MTVPLEECFSEENIIRELCKLRAACAQKRHNQQFLYNISEDAPQPKSPEEIEGKSQLLYQLFPPRRQWNRPKFQKRQDKSSLEINTLALRTTVFRMKKQSKYQDATWLNKLNNFVRKIQSRVLEANDYKLNEPEIIPFKKSGHVYRPIAIYNLEDQLIDKLCAKYFRSIFDQDFLDNSYAFRTKKKNQEKCPQHHDAVDKLLDYRNSHDQQTLWIAECDIQKFFDCIHHPIAITALEEAVKRAEQRGVTVDNRAKQIFNSYLRSYSFKTVGKKKGDEWLHKHNRSGEIKWPEQKLKELHKNLLNENEIGIPQGGALSCVIVNLVLDKADRAVLQKPEQENQDLFYARYCDDIIIIHPQQAKCKEALEKYTETLKELRLPIHQPQSVDKYSKEFWKFKSKEPYLWGNKNQENAVPWAAFVGYQIRYDGLLRIRQNSVEKELKKQVKEAGKVLKYVLNSSENSCEQQYSPGIRLSKNQIIYRLEKRLIAMSVGDKKLGMASDQEPHCCWCAGFKVLKGRSIVSSQLKRLDRGRERQIRRLKRHLKDLEVNPSISRHQDTVKYWGHPFSYHGQFLH